MKLDKISIISIIALLLFLATSNIVFGEYIPPAPLKLENTSEGLWINNSWITGNANLDGWYAMGSRPDGGLYYGYEWTGSTWADYSTLLSGIEYIPNIDVVNIFKRDGVLYLLSAYAYSDDLVRVRYWNGNQWMREDQTVIRAEYISSYDHPAVFNMSGTWYLMVETKGFEWNGSAWLRDTAIDNGLPDEIYHGTPFVFEMDSTWYYISGTLEGTFTGYHWNGTGWTTNSSIVSGLGDIGTYSSAKAFNKDGTWYILAGDISGDTLGFRWTGSAWESYPAIMNGIPNRDSTVQHQAFYAGDPQNATDSYNISVNDVWYNGTTDLFYNVTYSPHEWQNITVYAYNSSGSGALSTSSIVQNTQIPNEPITITNTSNWIGNVGENLYVDFDFTDSDGDIPIFSCDRTDLFTDFNTSTGQGNWTAVAGIIYVTFGISDGYGSTDSFLMTISVAPKPPDPLNITNTTEGLWINHTWEALTDSGASEWYLFDGDSSGGLSAFNWSGSTWQSDTAITSGLPSFGAFASPEAFEKDGSPYLIVAIPSAIYGYEWDGSTWQTDAGIINGLSSISQPNIPATFQMGSTWYTIITPVSGTIAGYELIGDTWTTNATITSGLPGSFVWGSIDVFQMGSTWYSIFGDSSSLAGYQWTGSTWTSDAGILSGYPGGISSPIPEAFEKDGTWYLLVGDNSGNANGFNWTGSAWQTDTAISGGLGTTGNDRRALSAFEIAEPSIVVTDSYNVSVNDVWYNGSTDLFYNETYSGHSWQNITVWAYNSSANGALSENSISQNTQVSNNPISILNISASYSLNEGETFTLDANYTDPDSDTAVFTDNSSNWTINSATGEVSWLTTSDDVGTHYYRITVDDGYGSTDYQDFTVTVGEVMEVLSTDPIGDFDLDSNDAQRLSIELNFNATAVWYVDEIEIQTDYNTTTPEYYFTSTTPGVHNVTCVATDPINGTTDDFTWFITVTEDGEVPSVPAPVPRYRYEEVTDYISEVWDDAGAGGLGESFGEVIEDVEEVLTKDVSNQNVIWIILICVLLLAFAYYKE